jgi:hypothetical protein
MGARACDTKPASADAILDASLPAGPVCAVTFMGVTFMGAGFWVSSSEISLRLVQGR